MFRWFRRKDHHMPPRPQRPSGLTLVGEVTIMGLKYTINLPPVSVGDVAKRSVSLTIDSANAVVSELPGNATTFEFTVERDKPVALFLFDTDNSGNVSQPSPILAFTSTDTIPPPTPDMPTIGSVVQDD